LKNCFSTITVLFIFFVNTYGQQSDFSKMLSDVKTASYYDSTNLFKLGYKTISLAKKQNRNDVMANVYIYFGNYYYYIANISKAKEFYEKAKTLSNTKPYSPAYQLASLRTLFIDIEQRGNYNDTIIIANQIKIAQTNNDSILFLEGLNTLGILTEATTNYESSLRYYFKGLHYADSLNFNQYIGVFKNNIGLIRLNQQKTLEALEDFKAAYNYSAQSGNKRLAVHAAINWCLVLIQEKKFNEADSIFQSVLDYLSIQGNPLELASVYVNMGNINNALNYHQKAIQNYDKAIAVLSTHNFNSALIKAYAGKAFTLIKIKKYADAEDCIIKIESIIKHRYNLENRATLYQVKYNLLFTQNKINEAHAAYLVLTQVNDSISSINNSKQLNELYLQYKVKDHEIELKKSKIDNLELSQKFEKEKYYLNLSLSIAVIIILSVLLGSFIYISNLKRSKQEERSKILIKGIDEERTRIARDLHDDLGPALSLIKNYLSLLKSPKNEETIKDIQTKVDTAMNLTRNISKRIFPTILEKVGLERSLADLLEQTQTISNIICSFEFNPEFEKLSLEQKTHLFRISSECINNTLKHAQATALKIELTKNDKNYLFIYRDNGIGINEKMSHGVGLSSINQRANILGGSLKITNGEARGSIITIKFKSDNKL